MNRRRGPSKPSHVISGPQMGAFLGEFGAALAPGSGLLDAGGKYYSPTQQRQMPGLLESAREGDYGTAALQGLGLLGDALQFGGPVGLAAGGVLKFPGAVGRGIKAANALGKAGDIVPIHPPTKKVPMSQEDAAYWIENNRGVPSEVWDEAIQVNPEAYRAFRAQPASDWAQMTPQEKQSHVSMVRAKEREAELLAKGPDESMLGHMNLRSPAEEWAAQIAEAFKGTRPGDSMGFGSYRLEHITMPAGNPMVRVFDEATGKSVGSMHPSDVERYMAQIIEGPRNRLSPEVQSLIGSAKQPPGLLE